MRRVLVGLMALVLALGGGLLAAPQAQAAGRLRVSNPAPHQQLSQRPGWVSLAFDGTVKRSLLKVLVVDAQGANMVVGDLIYQGSAVLVQLSNDLPKGTYTVKYQVDRKKDGQPEGGAYQFAYGKGNWTSVVQSWSGKAQQPPEMANPDPLANGPVETPKTTPPVVEVSDAPTVVAPSPARTTGSVAPSRTPTPEMTATPGETATPAPPEAQPGDATSPVLWIIAAAIVVAAGAGAWLILRGRTQG